jgi:hypothetical protein
MTYGTLNVDSVVSSDGTTSGGLYGFKNRIINGAMNISQAASGGSITPASTGANAGNFAVDRFRIAYAQNSKLTAQQNKGSVALPAGFKNYLGVGIAATATVGVSDYFLVGQPIEGYNMIDLAWGTASAAPVTISFWAYSNTTGIFGGAINNSAYDRSYAFTYTINSANTWEYKTITIVGDQSGTWLTDTGVGAYVWFSLGSGSTVSKSSGSWGAGTYYSATGANNLLGSTSNYLYITGVQLEKGNAATSFDYRPYGTEFALCQRYCQVSSYDYTEADFATGVIYNSTTQISVRQNPVTMRAAPTLTVAQLSNIRCYAASASATPSAIVLDRAAKTTVTFAATISGLTVGQGSWLRLDGASAAITLSAEL